MEYFTIDAIADRADASNAVDEANRVAEPRSGSRETGGQDHSVIWKLTPYLKHHGFYVQF